MATLVPLPSFGSGAGSSAAMASPETNATASTTIPLYMFDLS
jgi:hypothetical protein